MRTTNIHGPFRILTCATTLIGTALLTACGAPASQTTGADSVTDDSGVAEIDQTPPTFQTPPPALPEGEGCYSLSANQWTETPCASDDYADAHYPNPELQFSLLSVPKTAAPHETVSLADGVVLLKFESVGTESDSKKGAESWSIQNNTNLFTGTNGDLDGVQFTDQSIPGGSDGVCIWNVDVTKQQYHKKCVAIPRTRPGGFDVGDEVQITGTVLAGGRLSIQALLPWAGGAFYGVVAKDMFGLSDHWHEVSGSVLGIGDGSLATFSHARVWTRLLVTSCKGDNLIEPTYQCPNDAAPALEPSAIASSAGNTEERNNLLPVIGEPPAHEPSIFWGNHFMVYTDYVSTVSGDCPKGTNPPYCLAPGQ
jgi:hypothetical protein